MKGFVKFTAHNYSIKNTTNHVKCRYVSAGRIDFVAIQEISIGEEITVCYSGDPSELKPVWFSVAEEM